MWLSLPRSLLQRLRAGKRITAFELWEGKYEECQTSLHMVLIILTG